MLSPVEVHEEAPLPPGGSPLTRAVRAVLIERRLPYTIGRMIDQVLCRVGARYQTTRVDGVRMRIRRGTWDSFFVQRILGDAEYTQGGFEIEPDWIVIDIGANIGSFTLHAATRAARVYAYEPGSEEYALLRRNVAHNEIRNVTMVRAAVAGYSGSATLRLGSDSGLNTIREDRQAGERGEEVVPCVTLEGLMDRHGIERCDLLKLDCEGAEYEILYRSPPSVLARVDRITMEYHSAPMEDKRAVADALGSYLEDHGFRITQYIDFAGHNCGMMRAERHA